MQVNFIQASPSKNMTVLITSHVDRTQYAHVAHTIMDYEYLHAEQVGFIEAPTYKDSVIRMAMSGGEFCGNAVLSLAAYCRYKALTKEDVFYIETSGVEAPLECFIQQTSSHIYEARAEMPAPLSVRPLEITVGKAFIPGHVVELDGISHFLTNTCLDKETYDAALQVLLEKIDNKAIGIIPYKEMDATTYEAKPFVHVRETGSSFFEQACGSGSLALGVYLSSLNAENSFDIHQPGGIIKVEVAEKNYISTSVKFTCEGFCEIE